jgi:hypothetical protein
LYFADQPQQVLTSTLDYGVTSDQLGRAQKVRDLHSSLGHPGRKVMIRMLNGGMIINCQFVSKDVEESYRILGECPACSQSKMTRPAAVSSKNHKTSRIGRNLHADIVDVSGHNSLVCVDEASGYLHAEPMANMSSEECTRIMNKIVSDYLIHGVGIPE